MSPTATATKNVLSELAQFEAAEREAKEHSSKLSHDLLNRNHRLLGHLDTPGATDELRRLPAPRARTVQRRRHAAEGNARRKARQGNRQARGRHSGTHPAGRASPPTRGRGKAGAGGVHPENIAAIIDAHRPEAEAIQAAIREKAAADHEFWANVTSFIQKLGALIGTVPTQRNVRVPGLDTAAEQMRTAERLDFPLPWTEARRV